MTAFLTSRRMLGNLGVLLLLGLWFVTLAPTQVGGPGAYLEVQGHSMDGTYATGDLVITRSQDTYRTGDIVAFRVGEGQVIHRIIGGDGVRGYTLQGDNNPDPDPWHPTDDEVIGKAWLHFEQKAWLLHLPSDPMFAGVSAGLLTLLVLAWDERPRRRRTVEDGIGTESSCGPAPVATPSPADSVDTMPGQRTPAQDSPALPRAR